MRKGTAFTPPHRPPLACRKGVAGGTCPHSIALRCANEPLRSAPRHLLRPIVSSGSTPQHLAGSIYTSGSAPRDFHGFISTPGSAPRHLRGLIPVSGSAPETLRDSNTVPRSAPRHLPRSTTTSSRAPFARFCAIPGSLFYVLFPPKKIRCEDVFT
jgi:hypothetical protein